MKIERHRMQSGLAARAEPASVPHWRQAGDAPEISLPMAAPAAFRRAHAAR